MKEVGHVPFWRNASAKTSSLQDTDHQARKNPTTRFPGQRCRCALLLVSSRGRCKPVGNHSRCCVKRQLFHDFEDWKIARLLQTHRENLLGARFSQEALVLGRAHLGSASSRVELLSHLSSQVICAECFNQYPELKPAQPKGNGKGHQAHTLLRSSLSMRTTGKSFTDP